MATHTVGRVVIVKLTDADGKSKWFVLWQMHGAIRGPHPMRYVQDTRRIFVHFFRFLRYGIAYGELVINANQMWLIIWTVSLSLAVGQEFRFAEELKAAVITMIIDALVVQQLMAIQQMLELELLVALVTDVDTAILLMQMVIEKYSARKKESIIKSIN